MAYRLIGKDCSIYIYDGGPQPGPPAWGAATALKALAQSVEVDDKLDVATFKALGDTRKVKRGESGETSIRLTLEVASTGVVDIDLGNLVKVEYRSLSTFSVPGTYIGLLTQNTTSAAEGPQTQTMVIECDADYDGRV